MIKRTSLETVCFLFDEGNANFSRNIYKVGLKIEKTLKILYNKTIKDIFVGNYKCFPLKLLCKNSACYL